MLSYQAAYTRRLDAFLAAVPDFPEASAFGATLSDARANLVSALRFAAEVRLRRGDLLPIPTSGQAGPDAYLVETLTLLPQADGRVEVLAGL